MRYVAGRLLDLGDGDVREPGDEVPEAAEWNQLPAYVGDQSIILVLEENDGTPPGINPVDTEASMEAALAKAATPRWTGASDAPIDTPAESPPAEEPQPVDEDDDDDEDEDEDEDGKGKPKASSESVPEAPSAPAPAKRAPAKKSTQQRRGGR